MHAEALRPTWTQGTGTTELLVTFFHVLLLLTVFSGACKHGTICAFVFSLLEHWKHVKRLRSKSRLLRRQKLLAVAEVGGTLGLVGPGLPFYFQRMTGRSSIDLVPSWCSCLNFATLLMLRCSYQTNSCLQTWKEVTSRNEKSPFYHNGALCGHSIDGELGRWRNCVKSNCMEFKKSIQ